MSDLMQRVVQKLEQADADHARGRDDVADGVTALTILLAESELVAGLAPEVKREVLRLLLRDRLDDATGFPRNEYTAEVWGRALNLLAPLEAP